MLSESESMSICPTNLIELGGEVNTSDLDLSSSKKSFSPRYHSDGIYLRKRCGESSQCRTRPPSPETRGQKCKTPPKVNQKNHARGIAREVHEEVLENGLFLTDKFAIVARLSGSTAKSLKHCLTTQLKPAGAQKLQNPEARVYLSPQDFCRGPRNDGRLKLVISRVLNYMILKFSKESGLNQRCAFKDYIKTFDVKRRFFEYRFGRPPVVLNCKDKVVSKVKRGLKLADKSRRAKCCKRPKSECYRYEHMKIFNIQGGVSKLWLRYCLGLKANPKRPNRNFIDEILQLLKKEWLIQKLLNEDASELQEIYRQKIKRMVNKRWTESSKNPAAQKSNKMPLSLCQFRKAVAFTYKKLKEMLNKCLP